MKNVSLTFVPIGGLCNRMRALASGVSIAERLGGTMTVCWKKNSDCLAEFSELFQPVRFDWLTVRPFTNRDWCFSLSRKRNLFLPGLARSLVFSTQITGTSDRSDDAVYEMIKGKRLFMISGYSLTNHFPLKELFIPVPELQKRINRQKKSFTGEVIGIHIRRGDNMHAIQKNSIDDYVRFMNEELDARPATRFYIATDSLDIKQDLKIRFSDKILSLDAVLERNSVQGMKDAVVDLWCLAATKRIVGSYYSSYSDLAAEMGGIELTIL